MRTPLVLLLALNLNAACNRPPQPVAQSKLTAAQFVSVFVELRQAQVKHPAQAAYEQAKRDILRKAGVTEADLQQFVKAHAHDLTLMAGVWDSIQAHISRSEPALK